MSVVEGRNRSSDPQTEEDPSRGREALTWILNAAVWLILFGVVGFGFLKLAATWFVSAQQGTGFFDPSGWAFVISCIVAVILCDLPPDDDGYPYPHRSEPRIRGWLKTKHAFEPPIWWFNIVGPIVAAMVWGLLTLVQAAPLNVTVDRGEIHINQAHEILVAGQTYQGSRREILTEVYPLSGTVDGFPVRLQFNETDYAIARVSGTYQISVTPELREYVRENPPQAIAAEDRSNYFHRRFARQFIPALTALVREEAQPGNTAVGDVNGWSRDRASVPMALRVGMQLDEMGYVFPTWLPEVELTHVSVENWNRE